MLSMPMLINYDAVSNEYQEDFNLTHYEIVISVECIQATNSFWLSFSHWYSPLVTYIMPSIVIIACYYKIVKSLSKQAISHASVIF